MLKPKDYVQPKTAIFCTVTHTTGKSRASSGETIQPTQIFKVFTCTWLDYKNDYQLVLFVPNIEHSLILLEGYGKDFQKITDEKRLKTLKLLYG